MTWTRAKTPTSCGNCGTPLGYGALVALFGAAKHPRCVDCAGVCPWPLPEVLPFRPQGKVERTPRAIGLLPIQERVRAFQARVLSEITLSEITPGAHEMDPIDDYDFDWLATKEG